MATVQDVIIQASLDETRTTLQEVDLNELLTKVNAYHKEEVEKVKTLREDYFFTELETDFVDWQTIYNNLLNYVTKINSVYVRYDTSSAYKTKVLPRDFQTLDRESNYYKDKQPETQAFYTLIGNEFNIFPAPKETIPNGIIFTGLEIANELALTDDESKIWNGRVTANYEVIISKLNEYIYRKQGDFNGIQDAENQYNKAFLALQKNLGNRQMKPQKRQQPDTSNFQ